MASTLHYLTVQDILWINLQVTKKVNHFNFARLEEAVYYQYAYGDSNTLVPQAARFLSGFLRMSPLDAANEATAFVGCLAFLRVNGRELELADAEGTEWVSKVAGKAHPAREAIEARVREADTHGHHVDVRSAVEWVLDHYPQTVQSLAGAAAA